MCPKKERKDGDNVSENMRSMTVGFKADTSGFKKGMDDMIEQLNALNKKLVDNQYSQRDCNKVIAEAKKKLRELEEQAAKNGGATEDEKKQMKELNQTIEEQTLMLSQLRTEQASLRNLIGETSRELTNNNDSWTVLKGTLANLASETLMKVAAGLKNLVADVIQTGEQFTASISKVGAIAGASAEELQQLEEAARLYGSTTMYSATQAADALQYMALAGWNTEQSIEGLPAVLNLAASSGMDLGKASDIVTDYITAFGLSVDDAARFVDIMSYAMSHSNTTTEMLGEAYKNCAATAHSMNISVEEVTAALMTMANAGVKGGEAGTTLNTIMTRLATDTKGCASALKEYGVEVYNEKGEMNSLSDILSGMIGVWDKLTQKQQANLSKVIAGTNQYSGFQTLMQGMSDKAKEAGMSFEDYTAALEECTGTADKMSAAMTDNLTGDLKAMESAFDELKLKIFDDAEQPLRSLVQLVTKSAVPAIEEIIKNLDKVLPVVVACASAMATFKMNLIIGEVITKVTAAIKAMTVAEKAAEIETKTLSAALKELGSANVIGIVLTAIVSIGSALLTAAAMQSEYTKEVERSATALDAYMQKMRELEQSYEDTAASAAGERELLELAIDDYMELSQKAVLTADEKKRLASVTEELSGKLGITTGELNAQKVSFEQLTKAADDYIRSLEGDAVRGYYEEIIKTSAVEMEKARQPMEEARQNLESEKVKLDYWLGEYKRLYGTEYGWDDGKSALRDGNQELVDEINKHQAAVLSLNQAYVDNKAAYNSAQADMENAKEGLDRLNKSEGDLTKSTATGAATLTDANRILQEGAENADEMGGAYASAADEVDEWKDKLTEANKALEDKKGALKLARQERNDAYKDMVKYAKQAVNADEEERKSALSALYVAQQRYAEAKKSVAELSTEVYNQQQAIKAIKKAYEEATEAAKPLDEKLKDLNKTSSSLRSEMNSLASTLKQLENGEKLSLNTLLDLIEKYPEYAAVLINAKDNVDLQRQALELLFEAKKNEYILTKQAAIEEIEASNKVTQAVIDDISKQIAAYEILGGFVGKMANEMASQRMQALKDEIAQNEKLIEDYKRQIGFVEGLDINSFTSSSGSSGGDKDKTTTKEETKTFEKPYTWDYKGETYTSVYSYKEGEYDAVKDADTSAKAYLGVLDRAKTLGKLTLGEEISNLQSLLKWEKLSADQRYDIRVRLYKAQEQLAKENAEIEKKRDEEAQKRRDEADKALLDRQNLALAAYNKLVNGRIEALEAESDAARKSADEQIQALDDVMKKRKQEQDDAKRQKELDQINAKLRYQQLDEFERRELERRKQDILNEQADVNFERNIEAQKASLSAGADAVQSRNDAAIAGLNASKTQFADRMAYLQGSQTYDQRVANNTKTQNITIVQNGLSGDQLLDRLRKELLKELGA